MNNRMVIHPHANLLPRMTAEEQASLKRSLHADGQLEPIILDNKGRIIDGRHRYWLLTDMGMEPDFETFEGTDEEILDYVVTKNLQRRHLTPAQKAALAAEIATVKGKGRKKKNPSADVISQTEAAEQVGTSIASAQRAAKILKDGQPELFEAVKNGRLEVKTALAAVKLSPEHQTAIALAKNPAKELKKHTPKKAKTPAVDRIFKLYTNLTKEEQKDLKDRMDEFDLLA